MQIVGPLGGATSMKPPPPRFPASGQVTAKASAVAIAASTAFPPAANTSRPASLAAAELLVTTPPVVCAERASGCAGESANSRWVDKSLRASDPQPPSPAFSRRRRVQVEGISVPFFKGAYLDNAKLD